MAAKVLIFWLYGSVDSVWLSTHPSLALSVFLLQLYSDDKSEYVSRISYFVLEFQVHVLDEQDPVISVELPSRQPTLTVAGVGEDNTYYKSNFIQFTRTEITFRYSL